MKKTRQTFSAKQDMIQHCASGRTMVCLNEEELTELRMQPLGTERKRVIREQ